MSNYKPVTKTEMLVLVFAVGLLCFKNPFKGILHLVQNSSEMQAGCAFGISPGRRVGFSSVSVGGFNLPGSRGRLLARQ